MYVLLIIILGFIVYKNIDHFRYNRFHLRNEQLLKENDKFISTNACKKISDVLLNHPKMTMGGFCIRFSDTHETKKLFSDNGLNNVYNIFKDVKIPGTNSYICNILILPVSSGITIGEHYDGTLDEKDWMNRQIMPVCTTVLYLNLPNKFTGGQLFLKKFNSSDVYKTIEPSIGKFVQFRGDMAHGVYEINSVEKVDRLSVVFEQYNVSKDIPFKIEPIFTEVERVGTEIHFS